MSWEKLRQPASKHPAGEAREGAIVRQPPRDTAPYTFARKYNEAPRRLIKISTFSPFFTPDETFSNSFTDFTGCRLISRITSPGISPALSAPLSGSTFVTTTP